MDRESDSCQWIAFQNCKAAWLCLARRGWSYFLSGKQNDSLERCYLGERPTVCGSFSCVRLFTVPIHASQHGCRLYAAALEETHCTVCRLLTLCAPHPRFGPRLRLNQRRCFLKVTKTGEEFLGDMGKKQWAVTKCCQYRWEGDTKIAWKRLGWEAPLLRLWVHVASLSWAEQARWYFDYGMVSFGYLHLTSSIKTHCVSVFCHVCTLEK